MTRPTDINLLEQLPILRYGRLLMDPGKLPSITFEQKGGTDTLYFTVMNEAVFEVPREHMLLSGKDAAAAFVRIVLSSAELGRFIWGQVLALAETIWALKEGQAPEFDGFELFIEPQADGLFVYYRLSMPSIGHHEEEEISLRGDAGVAFLSSKTHSWCLEFLGSRLLDPPKKITPVPVR